MTEDFLASPQFRYAIVPLVTASLGVGIKVVSKNDNYSSFRKEDLAVGLDLMLTSCLLFVLLTTDRALGLVRANEALRRALEGPGLDSGVVKDLHEQARLLSDHLAVSGWMMLVLFIATWSLSTVVRMWGWKNSQELRPIPGIAVPLAFGILSVIVVMAEASS